MSKETVERIQKMFMGAESPLSRIDPEFMKIIANFSQDEVIRANKLTEKSSGVMSRDK